MEMDQFQAMWESLALQNFAGGNKANCIEPELRIFPSARRPFTRAFASQTHPDPNQRLDPNFPGGTNGLL